MVSSWSARRSRLYIFAYVSEHSMLIHMGEHMSGGTTCRNMSRLVDEYDGKPMCINSICG